MTATERAQRTIDSIYAHDGKAATYTPPNPPGGAAVGCTVLLDSEDDQIDGFRGQPTMRGNLVKVRKAEVATPAKGGRFVITASGETLEVKSSPYHDEDPERLEHTMTVDKVTV